jgi:hypothetical protein
VQDLNFTASSSKCKVTPDGQYMIVSGLHPPQVKCYDLESVEHEVVPALGRGDCRLLRLCRMITQSWRSSAPIGRFGFTRNSVVIIRRERRNRDGT